MEDFEKTINEILKDIELMQKGIMAMEKLNDTRFKQLEWEIQKDKENIV